MDCGCKPSIEVDNGILVADQQLEFADAKTGEFPLSNVAEVENWLPQLSDAVETQKVLFADFD